MYLGLFSISGLLQAVFIGLLITLIFRGMRFSFRAREAIEASKARSNEERWQLALEATNDAGFSTRPVWTLMHRLVPYQDYPRMPLPVAESLAARAINLPSSACLGATPLPGES